MWTVVDVILGLLVCLLAPFRIISTASVQVDHFL